jgi:putative transposase
LPRYTESEARASKETHERKTRFTEGQIILKELKAGAKPATLRRKYGGETTLYNGRATYVGFEVSDFAKLRQFEDENRRLKEIVAEQALNIEALRIVADGKLLRPAPRKAAVQAVRERLYGDRETHQQRNFVKAVAATMSRSPRHLPIVTSSSLPARMIAARVSSASSGAYRLRSMFECCASG